MQNNWVTTFKIRLVVLVVPNINKKYYLLPTFLDRFALSSVVRMLISVKMEKSVILIAINK